MLQRPVFYARLCVIILAAALALPACKKANGGRTWKVWETWGGKKTPKTIDDGTALPVPPAQGQADMLGGLDLPPVSDLSGKSYEDLNKTGIPYGKGPRIEPSGQVSGLQQVLFAYDSSDLDAGARQTLDANAQWLTAHPNLVVQIEGHCDERGTTEYNYALGDRRAASVREYLASKGVNPANLVPISYGEDRPVATGQDEASWAQNRRAQFLVYQ